MTDLWLLQVAVASSVSTMRTTQSQKQQPAAASAPLFTSLRMNRSYDKHFPVIDLATSK